MILVKAKVLIAATLITSIVAAGYVAYAHLTDLQSIAIQAEKQLTASNISVRVLAKKLGVTYQLKTYNERQMQGLRKELEASREEVDELSAKFSEHDFEDLLEEKTGLLATRMRKATVQLWSEFENASN